jgi:signal peptidase I
MRLKRLALPNPIRFGDNALRMKSITLHVIILAAFLSGCGVAVKDTVVFQGTSMLPCIHDGDRLSVERFDQSKKFAASRGDVIAFWYPADPSKSYIKRVIGLPGDTVEIREGAVFINGNKLEEPYVEAERNLSRTSHPPLLSKNTTIMCWVITVMLPATLVSGD